MDDAEKRSLEEMLNKAFKDVELESPSSHFTKNVMDKIEALQGEGYTVYQPLISRRVLIACAVVLIICVVFFGANADLTSSSWFADVALSKYISAVTLPKLNFPVSNTVFYGIAVLGFMVFVQTTLLKGYFDKRLA